MHLTLFRTLVRSYSLSLVIPVTLEPFGKTDTCFTIHIDHIVGGALISFAENAYMEDILADKGFVRIP